MEAEKRPRKSPRLEPAADPGSGDAAPVEASNRGEEAAAASTSGTNSVECGHLGRLEHDMKMFISDIVSDECAPRCEHYLCETVVQKSSIFVCTVCNLRFCVGGAAMDNPQGHARWHANLEHHWVALCLNEPDKVYCFQCERALAMDAIIGMDKMKAETSNADDAERCEHFLCDDNDIDIIVSMIRSTEGDPIECHREKCSITVESNIMVCTECYNFFCSRADAKKKPKGHAWQHACQDGHWVAMWYNNPYEVYCFACGKNFSLSDNNGDGEMVIDSESGGHASGLAKYPIRGMPNLGNTCYLNALLQCLLVLGKLRTRMLGPDAPPGILGMVLTELFEETNNVNNAGGQLSPMMFLDCLRVVDPRFVSDDMQDSHELLCCLRNGLDSEEKLRKFLMQNGAPSEVAPTVMESIFGGHLSVITTCKCCLSNSVSSEVFYDLSVPLPSKKLPPTIVEPPQRNISSRYPGKAIPIKLLPLIGNSKTKNIQAITEGVDSQSTGLEKTFEALGVDSTEVEQIWQSKDVLHYALQSQKDEVQCEIVQVSSKAVDRLRSFDVKDEKIDIRTEYSHSSEAGIGNVFSEPEISIEEKAQSSNIACDEVEDIDSIISIEQCLTLLLKPRVIEWTCEDCIEDDKWLSTNGSKDGEQTVASTNENTEVDEDHTELSETITCQSEQSSDLTNLGVECTSSSRQPYGSDPQHQDSTSCSISNKTAEHDVGVQEVEVAPSCPPAEKQTYLPSGQDQYASMLNQDSGKRVKLDHTTHETEENQNELKGWNEGAIQTRRISKLPPVLAIHLKRSMGPVKVSGHVSFKENLDIGQFMDPSSEDKGNSSYRLIGVIEHIGLRPNVGHWIAYVRASQQEPSCDSSPWFCANDAIIKEVSLEEVLSCEAYLLFYERMED